MSVMEGKGFYYPNDTAFAPDGKIYVLNRSIEGRGGGRGMRVAICDSGDEYYGSFGDFGDGKGQFKWPSAICVAPDGRVVVSDEHFHKIIIYSKDGDFINEWGNLGSEKGLLDTPSGLAVNGWDELFISDTYNHRIQVFTLNGKFKRSFGHGPLPEENLKLPWRLSIGPDSNVYVADWANDRICKFSQSGKFLSAFGSSGKNEGEFHRPADVVSDEKGYIYVCDWGNERVQVLDMGGNFVQMTYGASSLSPWARNFLEVNVEEGAARARSDLHKKDIPFVDPNDRHEVASHIEKFFWAPMALCIGPDNRLYVTESNRHRIQIFAI